MGVSEIRALSVRQPWAWGICAGVKTTENRTWTTDHRGTIAIHASTSTQVVNSMRKETGRDSLDRKNFSFGAIIGLADLVEVASYGQQHEQDPFAEGPYCWRMSNGRFLKEPIPLPGKLNLFKLTEVVQDALRTAETFAIDLSSNELAASIALAMTGQPDPVASYIELVEEFWRTDNHSGAMLNAGNRLIELAPTEAVGYVIKASQLHSAEHSEECVSLLNRAVELDPTDIIALYLLSSSCLLATRTNEAIAAAEQLVKLAPDRDLSYEARANARFQAKQFPSAIADLDFALQITPDSAHLLGLRAEAKVANEDCRGAKSDIAKALRLEPGNKVLIELQQRLFGAN